MKYLIRNAIVILIIHFGYLSFSQTINNESTLKCMQGIWSPMNSQNTALQEYILKRDFKSISIAYNSQSKAIEALSVIYEGFYNFPGIKDFPSRKKDSLNVKNLLKDGAYYVWIREKDVNKEGWSKFSGFQKGYSCSENFIEMNDNSATILERKSFLPYSIYKVVSVQGKKEGRDYIKEFGIQPKMAKINIDKTFFYNEPDLSTKRKGFVVLRDTVFIEEIKAEWIKVVFEGKTLTIGWLKLSDVSL